MSWPGWSNRWILPKGYAEQTPQERFPDREFHWYQWIVGPFETVEQCQAEYDRAYADGKAYQPPAGVPSRSAS